MLETHTLLTKHFFATGSDFYNLFIIHKPKQKWNEKKSI